MIYHFYFQVKWRYCKIYVVILKKCGVVNVVPSYLRPIDGLSKYIEFWYILTYMKFWSSYNEMLFVYLWFTLGRRHLITILKKTKKNDDFSIPHFEQIVKT